MKRRRPARILDIAQEAGVGTATVDRVLNGREGVSEVTAARVRHAMELLSARNSSGRRAAGPGFRFDFDVILPADAGRSTEYLGEAMRTIGHENRVAVTCSFVEKMNPTALAAKLTEGLKRGKSGIVFQALDHPLVRDAVAQLAAKGIPTLALMSDLHGSEVCAYVGTDNRAAGRTAGLLMGRFARTAGKVAVLWGGQLYRSHEEREIGFRSVLRSEYPQFEVLDLVAGHDDVQGNYDQIRSVLDRLSDLVGIYSVGGGNRGVVRALTERKRAEDVILIGHNLTATTQRYLLDGSMDAVIHQDMRAAARMAVSALIDHCDRRPVSVEQLPIEIIVKENMLGRLRVMDG